MAYKYTEREVLILDHVDEHNVSIEDILKTINDPEEEDDAGEITATRTLSDKRKLTITYSFASTLDNLDTYIPIIEKIEVEDT